MRNKKGNNEMHHIYNKKLNDTGVYTLNYISKNDRRIVFVQQLAIFFLYILLYLAAAASVILIYSSILQRKIIFDDNFSWEIVADNLKNGAAIISGLAGIAMTIITFVIDRKNKFSKRLIERIINKKYKHNLNKQKSQEVDDTMFLLANNMIANISIHKSSENKFFVIEVEHQIDNYELLYAVYEQIHKLKFTYKEDYDEIIKEYNIENIVLYDFAKIANGDESKKCCKEIIKKYKEVNALKDIIIIVNMQYLPKDDRNRLIHNLQSNITLANSVFALNESTIYKIKSLLDNLGIKNLSDVETENQKLLALNIINAVYGYIPKDFYNKLYGTKNYYKNEFIKKRKLYYSRKKVLTINKNSIENKIKENKEKSKNINSEKVDENVFNIVYNFFKSKNNIISQLELAALLNYFEQEEINAIQALIKKDLFNIASQLLELYNIAEMKKNIDALLIYKALIAERFGRISRANYLLSLICNKNHYGVDSSGKVVIKNSLNKQPTDIENQYAFVIFENTHGQLQNRKNLLAIINQYRTYDLLFDYWEYHINMEEGLPNPSGLTKWIEKFSDKTDKLSEGYRYFHNLRRAYTDLANSTYINAINCNFDENQDNNVLTMLDMVYDINLFDNLFCYNTHYRRFAIGDLIMNYCIPVKELANRDFNDSIYIHLYSHGLKDGNITTNNLIELAEKTYDYCINNFENTKDKTLKTTKTRKIALTLMNNDLSKFNILEREVIDFYKDSNFEVFISYGIALQLKLYFLKLLEIDLILLSEFATIQLPQDMSKNAIYCQFTMIIDKINDLFKAINTKEFSSFSNSRFKFMSSLFNAWKNSFYNLFKIEENQCYESIQNTNIGAQILSQKLSKCDFISIFAGVKPLGLDKNLIDRLSNKRKVHDLTTLQKLLRYYPIILL